MPKLHSIKILKLYYMIVHIMGLHVGHSWSPSIWLTFFGCGSFGVMTFLEVRYKHYGPFCI